MRIQHNIPAMSSYRNYTANVSALAKNLEKLSSGYKINRAGDDAAGLAISEKMRAQISGLEQAQSNAKDGISLIQTAEGALTEVHDMLNRMYTLAEQSANGTYDNDVDRLQLQKEVNQLRTEINRIADSSNFNGIKLLDGSMEEGKNLARTTIDLPDVGTTLGANTVLHVEKATPTTGSSFSVDLGNLYALGTGTTTKSTVTIKIGDNDYSAQINNQNTSNQEPNDIAGSLVSQMNNKTFTDSNGNTFTLTTGNATKANQIKVSNSNGIITFEQSVAPSSEDTVLTTPKGAILNISDGRWGGDSGDTDNTANHGQDYNVATVNQKQVNLGETPRLASTFFDMTSDMVKSGASLTLGNQTYKFTNDISKQADTSSGKYTGGEIYIGDLDTNTADGLQRAIIRLTEAAATDGANNLQKSKTFSVGYDGNRITLTELQNSRDTSGANNYKAGEAGKPFDFTTLNGLKKAIKFQGAASTGKALTLQIGDTSDSFNQLKVSVNDCHSAAIGIGGIDISTQAGASAAMRDIKNAINYVSNVRGTLGATQNRLDHTINNLSVMQENIQDAESTIRDVDVAKEMMSYTKNSILVQSAQAMLAQANQLPQGVLQLLQ